MENEFSVCQFYADGRYRYIARFIHPQLAMEVFAQCLKDPLSHRVIITDGGDCINAEWKRGEGMTYPPPAALN